jgi:hypothetical protein
MSDDTPRGFSATWEAVKHVAKKAVKWAALAAVVAGVGGAVFGVMPLLGAATALDGMIAGVQWGAALGAIAGAVSGMGGAADAVEDAREAAIAKERGAEVRQLRVAAIKQQQAARAGLPGGVSPGYSPGMGAGEERSV